MTDRVRAPRRHWITQMPLATNANPTHRQCRPRALLYSHDTFGLGHLRRNLVIADQLLSRSRNFEVMLVSGSPVAESWPMPPGLKLRLMPPVVKIGTEAYTPRDGAMTFADVKARREKVILDAILDFSPDVMLVDHAPAGMKGELLPALSLLRSLMPATRTILGLRDILDDEASVCRLWQQEGTYDVIRDLYDQVLVYGSRELFDVVERYRLPPAIAGRLHYCGHVARVQGPILDEDIPPRRRFGQTVLVTVGGGGDGYGVIDAYLSALDRLPIPPARSVIVAGPLMPDDQQRAIAAAVAHRPGVVMVGATVEMPRLQAEADLIVGMAGYNSTVEILAARKPAILIPRAQPRAEQRLRAKLLADLELVWAVHPDDDMVPTLARLLQSALSGDEPPALRSGMLDLHGARRVGDALESLIDMEQV